MHWAEDICRIFFFFQTENFLLVHALVYVENEVWPLEIDTLVFRHKSPIFSRVSELLKRVQQKVD